MSNIYRLVAKSGVKDLTLEELKKNEEIDGKEDRTNLKKELQGQPKVRGFLGPMWDGTLDGKNVIRYETQEVYDIMSR